MAKQKRALNRTKGRIQPKRKRSTDLKSVSLRRELIEARREQVATAEILKVISRSTNDLRPVLDAIAETAAHLCGADFAFVYKLEANTFHLAASSNANADWVKYVRDHPVSPGRGTAVGRTLFERRTVHIKDVLADRDYTDVQRQRLGKYRTILGVPLLHNQTPIGSIILLRSKVKPFSVTQVNLVETFADQAVIAIENAGLFNETQEALERQTATADILKVIASSPDDVRPVFEAIGESANKLVGAHGTTVLRIVGDMVELAAFTPVGKEADAVLRSSFPLPIAGNPHYEKLRRGEIAEAADTEAAHSPLRDIARARGYRSRLLVPLKDDSGVVGAISVTRKEPGAFAAHHVQLLQTFADQAVIAIRNVRLFNETKEALEQQTATSEVLSVISRSAGDLAPVFEAMLGKAMQLCGADFGVLNTCDGAHFNTEATFGLPPAYDEFRSGRPLAYGPTTAPARLLKGEPFVEDYDLLESDAYRNGEANRPALVDLGGARCLLAVPLLKDERVVGNVMIFRQENRQFSEKQITLLQQFAAQAVIAIENARLLNELRQRTDDLSESLQQQTATAEVLKVIASSPTDVDPALHSIVESACELCEAMDAVVLLRDGDDLRFSAHHGPIPINVDKWPISRNWAAGRAFVDRIAVHVPDIFSEQASDYTASRELTERAGSIEIHSVLAVPLLREGESIGAILLRRQEERAFDEKQIALLQTFADQAVIAIGNVRLFEEVQQRTRELSKSLDDLRTAQDRLIQTEKLASLGQLTAGIAHEIKNPLNFVNNFSTLSAELTDELNDILKSAALTDQMQVEVSELTRLLKENLAKVVQHGKRADSIVKNMLLHSREGSGEQCSADINALVDESLNLAYHGARAEKNGFNITLQRDFDTDAGSADLFPQEITRALLNLISNGFYAATKRGSDGEAGFDPTLLAATKSLGNSVEIRIRDNGAGIPSEIKEKIFNPFFTTKPAGEGTGLGLSMSHDIIVKQHGGTIRVNTELGVFTEFIVTLPRALSVQSPQRSTN